MSDVKMTITRKPILSILKKHKNVSQIIETVKKKQYYVDERLIIIPSRSKTYHAYSPVGEATIDSLSSKETIKTLEFLANYQVPEVVKLLLSRADNEAYYNDSNRVWGLVIHPESIIIKLRKRKQSKTYYYINSTGEILTEKSIKCHNRMSEESYVRITYDPSTRTFQIKARDFSYPSTQYVNISLTFPEKTPLLKRLLWSEPRSIKEVLSFIFPGVPAEKILSVRGHVTFPTSKKYHFQMTINTKNDDGTERTMLCRAKIDPEKCTITYYGLSYVDGIYNITLPITDTDDARSADIVSPTTFEEALQIMKISFDENVQAKATMKSTFHLHGWQKIVTDQYPLSIEYLYYDNKFVWIISFCKKNKMEITRAIIDTSRITKRKTLYRGEVIPLTVNDLDDIKNFLSLL